MRLRSCVAVLLAPAMMIISGCTSHTVTRTINGHTVTAAPKSDIDACKAISAATLDAIGLGDKTPVELVDPAKPGCEWKGRNPYKDPDLILWVLGTGHAEADDQTLTISGATVHIYVLRVDNGRYIVPCGKHELAVSYIQAKGPMGPKEALGRATRDAIASYGCAGR